VPRDDTIVWDRPGAPKAIHQLAGREEISVLD
jgi:hypothetical protein